MNAHQQHGPSVAVIPRARGGLTRSAAPGLTLTGPAGVLWVPLTEAYALADALVDAAEALEAHGRAARQWIAEQNAADRERRNRA